MGKKTFLITNREILLNYLKNYVTATLSLYICMCVCVRVRVFYVAAEMSSLDSEKENKRSSNKNTGKPVRLKQLKDGFSDWQLI